MCAKKNSKSVLEKHPPTPQAAQPAATTAAGPTPADTTESGAHVAWMDSPDPRKRLVGQLAFAAVWVYVAALCLLALDQTFGWGIF